MLFATAPHGTIGFLLASYWKGTQSSVGFFKTDKKKKTHVIFQDFKGPYTVADYCMCLNSESMQLKQFS